MWNGFSTCVVCKVETVIQIWFEMHWKAKHEVIKAIKSFIIIYHLFSKFATNSISKFNNWKISQCHIRPSYILMIHACHFPPLFFIVDLPLNMLVKSGNTTDWWTWHWCWRAGRNWAMLLPSGVWLLMKKGWGQATGYGQCCVAFTISTLMDGWKKRHPAHKTAPFH